MKKEKSKRKMNISMGTFITILIVFICVIVLGIFVLVSNMIFASNYRSQLIDDMKQQCNVLADNIVNNDFNVDEPLNLNSDIESIASFFDGRIIVVDSNYNIVKDSFNNDNNSYIISDEIINAMKSDNLDDIKQKTGYIQYIRQLRIDDEVQGLIVLNMSTKKYTNIIRSMNEKNLIIFGILLCFCIMLAIIIGRISVRGIKYINHQIEASNDGRYDALIKEKGFKEFRNLIENYNSTVSKFSEIDSSRQEFVSNVSHELKTPITSMKVLADSLVQNDDANLMMYKEFMNDIVAEIDRESKIITDLLTLVKMDKKSAQMNVEEISINELMDVIIKRVMPIAQTRNIDISYDSYKEIIADADEVKLSLALSNIIENAVKYNIDNGWVKISLNADHKNFYIKVVDSGVGIPDDCKDMVFERFYRVDKARSRDTGGTGLGLAITKNVVNMHNGIIKLYSESGAGTTFSIKIPLKYTKREK